MQPSWKHTKKIIYSLLRNILCLNFFFSTDSLKTEAGVAACCSSCLHQKFSENVCLSASGRQLYIYTAELQPILLAHKHVYCSRGRSLILWCYLTHYHRYKRFLTWNMTTLFWCRFWPGNLTRYGKKIVFIWVPGHVGIRGNLAADSAAKDGDISVELIPFSDLKSHANKYILELWQSESDDFLEN